jgi:aryl-alcohol dehydrogenase-like predicted oxidoreductase
MRYRILGRSGLRVSELALGTMTFGEDWGWGATHEESRRMFDAYAEAGGNFIDTAINYTNGTAERFVGEFLASDRDHFVLATKYTLSTRPDDPNFSGNHRKNLRRSVEHSLAALRTGFIDLLWLHMWDYTTPVEEIMRGLDDLVRAGKVLHVGVSDTPAWVIARANTVAEMRGWTPFSAVQIPYSLARRDVEREILPVAKAFDMTVTPWGLLGAGVLTGKYNRKGDEPKRRNPADVPEAQLKLAGVVAEVASEIDRSPSQVAINWVRAQEHRAPIVPILGARSLPQLEDNLGCLDFELDAAAVERLEAASGFEPGFPRDFLESENIRKLIFGESFPLLDDPRRGERR